eukprot:TRINITY_DN5413_c0_g1_i2.p1 TRINITY_DN5413_c0_g1~~TRINITY_DN5413_c0_g1_i2.p1  ORF type:complete len:340 (-),score=80.09 TRINITY_DN5413_c0_g1_i2:83-1102(-)
MVAAISQGSIEQMEENQIEVQSINGSMFRSAIAECQGRRPSYEDAHAITSKGHTAFFWVFDGHRGDSASRFAAKLFSSQEYGPKKDKLPSNKRILQIFESADNSLRSHLCSNHLKKAGSTAIGALAARTSDGTYVAKLVNCGDSRAVVIRAPSEQEGCAAGIQVKLPKSLELIRRAVQAEWSQDASWLPGWPAVVETIDHKPALWGERARIEAAGGTVCGGRRARLDGHLAVSRGLGDFDFKEDKNRTAAEQKVSCVPDIYEISGLMEGSLILLACDGLWDVISSEEAADFVRERLQNDPPMSLSEIAHDLVDFSLEQETGDNVTVMLVQLGAEGQTAR